MQADKNVITLSLLDRETLSKNLKNIKSKEVKKLYENSSAFESSDFEPFLKHL